MLSKPERKVRSIAQRKALKDARDGISSPSSPNSSGVGGGDDHAGRPTVQAARGAPFDLTATGDAPKRRNRGNRDDERVATGEFAGIGIATGQPEKGSRGAAPNSATDATDAGQERHDGSAAAKPVASVGNFYTDVAIETPLSMDDRSATFDASIPPEKGRYKAEYRRTTRDGTNCYAQITRPELIISNDEYKALPEKSDKQASEPKSVPFYKLGAVLSKREADDAYEPFVAALGDGGIYVDKFLHSACPQLEERPVWGNLTDIECGAIARIILKRAQIDPLTATSVRTVLDSADYATAIMALAPRLMETGRAIRDRPIKPKSERKRFSVIRTTDGRGQ